MSELVTAVELGKRLGLRPGTKKIWAREGIIPAMRLTGKVLRFDVAAVDEALRRRAAERETRHAD